MAESSLDNEKVTNILLHQVVKTDQIFGSQAFDENKKLSEEPFIKKGDQQKIEWDLIVPKVLFLGKKENT
jgi:hypothetical protein